MKIDDLGPRDAITTAPSETVRAAAKRLIEDEIGALVVFGPVAPLGIFSERDLARAVADDADLDQVQVKEYMTDAPVIVDREDSITAGISTMNEYGVRHLLVAERNGAFGVVSMRDVVRHLDARLPVRSGEL